MLKPFFLKTNINFTESAIAAARCSTGRNE